MKINNNDSIRFSANKTEGVKQEPVQSELKKVEANSLDALDASGRAQIKMSFKGERTNQKFEIKQLSKEELEILQEDLFKKIDKLIEEGYDKESLKDISKYIDTPESAQLAEIVLNNEKLYGNDRFIKETRDMLFFESIPVIAQMQADILSKILNDEKLINNKTLIDNIGGMINAIDSTERVEFIERILNNEELLQCETFLTNARKIVSNLHGYIPETIEVGNIIINNKRLYTNEEFMKFSGDVVNYVFLDENIGEILKILNNKEIPPQQIPIILFEKNEIPNALITDLNEVMGVENTEKLSKKETLTASKFLDLYDKENINEIPLYKKREFLRNIISENVELFNLSDDMREFFPLLPTNQEEYCKILPIIVRSIGIPTNSLDNEQIQRFNYDIKELSNSLADLSDEEFNGLDFKLDYSKDSFIRDVYNITKDLPALERQKVFDYYGFELSKNYNAKTKINIDGEKTGFSIVGYPADLNNEEKLSSIDSPAAKYVIEKLRPYVIRFSEGNKIICNNSKIQKSLNEIIKSMPELIPQIDNIQAGMNGTKGSHVFDIFKHSLKVMQKISQDSNYQKLNDSDKKVMLLASLLHDVTKKEGLTDPSHSDNSSFDAYFITKKLKLSSEEEIKLFNLIKHHEWLGYVNTANNQNDFESRIKSTAYDFRHDNILDLALIFTHADLKGVKDSDIFHDTTEGQIRTDFNGTVMNLGDRADKYAYLIKEYINQLRPSQPLLPVTKIPNASVIKKAVTEINEDGSTNIKGVYVNSKGMIIIKYNEVENESWEKIGFKKGTISKGIKTETEAGEEVDTGNIKFFVHGLDFSNQLINFDAFSLPDSNALLSVSYAERPESKYKFFRPQGILLDVDTKYIHGGGDSDSASGCRKLIKDFKDEYIFGGYKEPDRIYISNLIKNALNLDNEEYLEFVKQNENKSITEIEPKEAREKLIKAFCSINSAERNAKRYYNEMYVTNPKKPMGVFAYSVDDDVKVDNPVDFLNRDTETDYEISLDDDWDLPHKPIKDKTKFLKEYALLNDVPFFIFGD